MAETVSSAQLVPEVMPEERTREDLQDIRATPEMFGSRIGTGMQQAGQAVEHTALDLANFQGEVNVDDQVNHFITARDNILHGDPNKKTVGPDGQPTTDRGYYGLEGRALLDNRQATLDSLEEARKAGRANLKSPKEQFEFDQQTRRLTSDAVQRMGLRADEGWRTWAVGVNNSSATLAMNGFLRNLNDPEAMAHNASDYINSKVKELTIKYGDDNQIKSQVIASAKADLVKEQVLALSVNDPAGAKRVLENNRETAGAFYEPLSNQLRARADQQVGIEAATTAVQAAHGDHGGNFNALPTGPAARDTRARAAYDFFVSRGWGPVQASGIVGNLLSETGWLNPEQIHDNGVGLGIAGWNGDRLAALRQYASSRGKPATDMQTQLEFVDRELRGNESAAGTRLAAATTPEQAGQAVLSYERPSNWDAPGAHPERASTSRAVYERLHDPNAPPLTSVVFQTQPTGLMPHAPLPNGGDAYALRAAAYRNLMSMDLNENQLWHATQVINRNFAEAQVAAEADTKAKKDADENAMGGYVSTMMKDGAASPDLMDKIANDAALSGPSKENLYKFATQDFGFESMTQFGPAYSDIYKRIFAPPGDPTRIGDLNEIMQLGAPGQGLTPRGVDRLSKVLMASRKDPDQAAVNQAKAGLINYAKLKLSFEEDTGPIKIRDPKGEQIFNAQFIPKFESAYDAWIKAGKNPWEFLAQENVDKLMTGLRPKAQMDADRLAALGAVVPTAEDKTAPPPATPEGINPAGWVPLVTKPPTLTSGQTMSREAWSRALSTLAKDPSEKVQQQFDQVFGGAGYSSKDVLGKLKPSAAPAATPASENEALGYGPAKKVPDDWRGPAGALGDVLLRYLTSVGGKGQPPQNYDEHYQPPTLGARG